MSAFDPKQTSLLLRFVRQVFEPPLTGSFGRASDQTIRSFFRRFGSDSHVHTVGSIQDDFPVSGCDVSWLVVEFVPCHGDRNANSLAQFLMSAFHPFATLAA